MKKIRMNKKGFTLIELLAVIVILAILMTLAVVSIQGIMTNARKDTFATTAQQYSNAVRFSIVNGDYETPAPGACTAVDITKIELDSGTTNSPFGKEIVTGYNWVIVKNIAGAGSNDSRLEYYVTMRDGTGSTTASNGFAPTLEAEITGDIVIGNYEGVNYTAAGTAVGCSSTTLES